MTTHLPDMVGAIFGRLRVTAFGGMRKNQRLWKCQCSCGRETLVPTGNLNNGNSKSCGCARSEGLSRAWDRREPHRMKGTPTYNTWVGMVGRCTNENRKDFAAYGAVGITVCERWREFSNFFADMGERPAGKTLDRIDNQGNYEPGNCRWATLKEQAYNSRSVRLLEIRGRTMCIKDWAREVGMWDVTIGARLARGWPPEKAVFTPISNSRRYA